MSPLDSVRSADARCFRGGLRVAIVQLALVSLLATAALAATPSQVAYQGLLLDSNGAPVTGVVSIRVTLYDDLLVGNALWTESHGAVDVLDGVYSIELGSFTPLTGAILESGSVFLEIEIDGETLIPRQQLLAVPYALEAGNFGGIPSQFFVQLMEDVSFDGGDPPNLDPSEGLWDTDGDGVANFVDSDNDNDGISDTAEIIAGSDINLISPTISSLSPPTADGFVSTPVSIFGTNFTAGSTVVFGSQTPAIVSATATQLDVVVGPQAPGPVTVSVTHPNGESASTGSSFFFVDPTITGFVPPFLPLGMTETLITIQGTGFVAGMTVQFGAQNLTPANITFNSLEVTYSPSTSGQIPVVVTHPNGETGNATFFVGTIEGLVFVAGPTDGNMGGLSGADGICQSEASAAGLTGTYKAWLSDSTQSPSTRFRRDVAGYSNTQGILLANSWDDLTDGMLAASVQYDANGVVMQGTVWTNTDVSGAPSSASNCSDWTSTTGVSDVGASFSAVSSWTLFGTAASCSNSNFIYCFLDQ